MYNDNHPLPAQSDDQVTITLSRKQQRLLINSGLAMIQAQQSDDQKAAMLKLGTNLLSFVLTYDPDNYQALLGLAFAHIKRLINIADGTSYSVHGVMLFEEQDGQWAPSPRMASASEQCLEYLDRAVNAAPKDMRAELAMFRDRYQELSTLPA